MAAKRMEFLKEVAPTAKRVAVIFNPQHFDDEVTPPEETMQAYARDPRGVAKRALHGKRAIDRAAGAFSAARR